MATEDKMTWDELWIAVGELKHRLADIEQWAQLVARELFKDDGTFSPPKENELEEF